MRPALLFVLAAAILTPGFSAQAASVSLVSGQGAALGPQQLTVLSVRDSRCPMNARCIRAGELKASVLVRQGAQVRLLRLEFPENPSVPWADLRISAAPERMAGDRTPVPVTLTNERP